MSADARTLLRYLRRQTAPQPADAALLGDWAERRDEAAFAELVARHGPMVLGVCRRIVGDEQHAEDAFQATFLVLARRPATRPPRSVPGFLYGVALRLAKKARGSLCRSRTQPLPDHIDPHPHPLDYLSGRELLAAIDQEISRLKEVFRLPVLLCVLQERSVEEAARLLGWGIGSVRGRLARGRQRLRERLARRGLHLSAGTVALPSPAMLNERLSAAVLCNLTEPASEAVQTLVAGSAPSLFRRSMFFGLVLVAAVVGAGWSLPRAPEPRPPAVVIPVRQAKAEPRRDLYGDPLPAGAILRLGTLRFRAPGEINALAFAPDGKMLAVASNFGLVTFDAEGKRIARLPTPRNGWGVYNRITFSPDGKRLSGRALVKVEGKQQGVVRVWDSTGRNEPRDYNTPGVIWLGWSAAGEPLAVCLETGAICLRELAAGRSRRFTAKYEPKPPLFNNTACDYAVGGKTLAVASGDRAAVSVWDGATGELRHTLRPKGKFVLHLAISDDGGKLAVSNQKGFQVWDLATGKDLFTKDNQTTYRNLLFSPDGKILAVLQSYDTVSFRDATTGREVGRTREKYFFAEAFHFSSDGKTLATAERYSGTVHLFDVATGRLKPEPVGHGSSPHGAAFAPDGRRVVTAGGMDGIVHVWDLATGKSLVRVRKPERMVRDVVLSGDGRELFSSWADDRLWISDAATGALRYTILLADPDAPETRQSATSMGLSDDGKTLVAVSSYYAKQGGGPQDTLITGWDTTTREQRFRRRRPGPDVWSALSPDAQALAVSSADTEKLGAGIGRGPMRVEATATGEVLLQFPALPGQNWPLAFSPDGRLLAATNSDKGYTLRLWEVATASEILSLPLAPNSRPGFSADGRLLALVTPDSEIQVWDLSRGRERRPFKGSDAGVTWLAFSPDGRKLLSGHDNSTLLIWDLGEPEDLPPGKLNANGVAQAWADLASDDAGRAFRARWALVSSPAGTVAFLKDRLHPARPAERLRRLLDELNSEQFAVRTRAQAGLVELGDLAGPALRKVLAADPTLEVRRRGPQGVGKFSGPVTRPELRQGLRAVAVLEDLGTPAARRLLTALASGAAEARLTREAREALTRLGRRKIPATLPK